MDDKVLDNLYQPISKVNPQDAVCKLKYWSERIGLHLSKSKKIKFSYRSLCQELARNGRPPDCLLYVMTQLEKEGLIQSLSSFVLSSAWSAHNLVNSLSSLFIDSADKEYIHCERAKELETVITHVAGDNVYSLEELVGMLEYSLDEELLGAVLQRMGTGYIRDTLVKVNGTISDSDLSMHRCGVMANELAVQRELTISSLHEVTQQIRDRVHSSNRLKTIRLMRKRKRMEARVDYFDSVIFNLNTIVTQHDFNLQNKSLLNLLQLSNITPALDLGELTHTMDECNAVLEEMDSLDFTVPRGVLEEEYNELCDEVVLPTVRHLPTPVVPDEEPVAQME